MASAVAGVDFCPAAAPLASAPGAPEYGCNACAEAFATPAEQRAHCKSERHVYNTKRRLAGLKPISLEAWERKLRESRGGAQGAKGTAHLKAKKAPSREERGDAPGEAAEGLGPERAPEPAAAAREEDAPWTPEQSLFDRRRFCDVEECLKYMWKTYGFFIPDREYCTDVPGLLRALRRKIAEPPHACLFCHRRFPDAAGVRQHMLDKSHCRVGTEARSRRGGIDELGSEEMQAELEDFYDFHGSTREITERITEPRQKVAALLRFWDADRDGRLRRQELARLWAATTAGAQLTEAQYGSACEMAGADPGEGLNAEELGHLYSEGLADLDAHFAVLQDLLAQKLAKPRARGLARPGAEAEAAREAAAEERGGEPGEDAAGSDDEASSSSEADVVECEDEDEFEEVMRVLGLQPATLTETGDLRLPNGTVAAHRDVAYIWRQRGQRFGELALPGGRAPGRTPLMLAGGEGSRGALTQRQQARDERTVIAVLRQQQKHELRLGVQQNTLNLRKGKKIRTVFGDASGGR